MQNEIEMYEKLEKELWGALHFEMPLYSLYNFLHVNSYNITLSNFADWVVFPHKIPLSIVHQLYEGMLARYENPNYSSFLNQESDCEEEEKLHTLVMELLYIKATGNDFKTTRLHALFNIPIQVFYSISLQLVERGFCSAESMMQVYTKYQYLQEKGGG